METCLEYSSLWCLGVDCTSQEFVNQLECIHNGNGVFTWVEQGDIVKGVKFLCDRLDLTKGFPETIAREYPIGHTYAPYFPEYDIGWNHLINDKRWYGTVAPNKVWEVYTTRAEKVIKRYRRMLNELDDSTACPLFIRLGFGPRKRCNIEGGDYFDMEAPKEALKLLRSTFPADIRMLYMDQSIEKGAEKVVYDAHLIGIRHNISHEMRLGRQRLTVKNLLANNPEIRLSIHRAPDFKERCLKTGNRIDTIRVRHKNWQDELIINRTQNVVMRRENVTLKGDVVEYVPETSITIRWRGGGAEETFVKDGAFWEFTGM